MRLLKLSFVISLALGLLFGLSVFVTRPAVQAAPTGTLQTWINNAPSGGTVIIPAGTYTESLTVNKTLTLTGVSSGTTTIQAVSGQRVITVTSGHDLRLENLTITGGQTGDAGGGVYLVNGSLTLVNSRLVSNAAAYGGGVFQSGADRRVNVIGSRIELNTSTNHGGGLYVEGSAAFTNTLVLSNTASWHGGGVHAQSGRIDVSGGTLSNNRAVNGNGGALNLNNSLSLSGTLIVSNTALNGGGVQQWNTAPTVLITNTRFERNLARSVGGGAAISGTLFISGSTFATNTVDSGDASSTFGGGLYAGIATQILASTFSGNSALCLNGGSCSHADGGGLYDRGSNVALSNVIFQSNRAGRMGGGMSSEFSSPVLTNVIFSGNKAGWGGGLNHDHGSPRLDQCALQRERGGLGRRDAGQSG